VTSIQFSDSPGLTGAFCGTSETAHQKGSLGLKTSISCCDFGILNHLFRFSMAAQSLSRKRPAPGSSPPPFLQQLQSAANGYSTAPIPQLSDEQFLQLGYNAQQPSSFGDASAYNQSANNSGGNSGQPSNQLTRRSMNQLANRGRSYNDSHGLQWVDSATGSGPPLDSAWNDDIEALEQRAQTAKKNAQEKRKQIPPFVQKLSR
jgi:heat shock transcription factor